MISYVHVSLVLVVDLYVHVTRTLTSVHSSFSDLAREEAFCPIFWESKFVREVGPDKQYTQ